MFLILSVLLNTYVGIIFSLFKKWNISNIQAIVVNYWVCVITGSVMLGRFNFFFQPASAHLDGFGFINGLSYFLVFIAIASSTLISGITATQIANKLSLVIPFVLAYFLYADNLNFIKIIGVLCALVAVYYAGKKTGIINNEQHKNSYTGLAILFFIFVGSGALDTLATFMQKKYLVNNELTNAYLILCFAGAAIAGTIYLIYLLSTGKQKFDARNIWGGILLGIPNYFSIYSLIKALDSNVLQSSALIPVNNIGVVLVSTLAAVVLFKEKLSKQNYFGLALSIIAIVLILVGDWYAK